MTTDGEGRPPGAPPAGPLERAVAALVPSVADAAPAGSLHVDRSPKAALGEVRVRLHLPGGPADAAAVRRLAAALGSLDAVLRTVAIPPRVYVTLDPSFVRASVVDGVRAGPCYGHDDEGGGRRVLLSFSDPNVNKPLHLGHLRNNALGMALCRLLESGGWSVECQADHNDWGLPLCQTAVGWRRWGGGRTPAEAGVKPDHWAGHFYARFHEEGGGAGNEEPTELDREAAALLQAVEAGDADALALCRTVNGWAEEGIQATYRRIGTRMDRIFYGSSYVEPGNRLLAEGVAAGRLLVRDDGSVYVDLGDEDLGEVTLVRRDGTPLLHRQWLAMDVDRFGHGDYDRAVIMNGREWRLGYETFFATLRRLGHGWVDDLTTIYYGMVNLPEGRMSSRRGAVVTADGLLDATAARLAGDGELADPESAAVSLLKHHFLSREREADVLYDEEEVWRTTRPRLLACAAVLAAARPAGHDDRPAGRAKAGPLHQLVLELDRLPETAWSARTQLEPSRLVRYVDRVVAAAGRAARDAPAEVRDATARTVTAALSMIDVPLPVAAEEEAAWAPTG